LLYVVLARRRWLVVDRDFWRRLPRIVTAAAVMGLTLLALRGLMTSTLDLTGSSIVRVASLAVLVASGLAVYLVALQLFGVAKLRELIAAIRHGI
jgi:peptidoglycan biosynthesis protein MviN/MurJ (putative lipid II flippase)